MTLILLGAKGRMGQAVAAAAARRGVAITAALDVDTAGDLARHLAPGRVVIDFTTPNASAAHLDLATLHPAALSAYVLGTTGFGAEVQGKLNALAQRAAVVQSGNYSLGINVLVGLVRQAAAALPDWDIEIIEAHHRHKADAPSGTGLMLGAAAATGRGVALADVRLPPREGITGPRPDGGIGFAVVRAGSLVGEHEVLLAGPGETLHLRHQAHDRGLFAEGALTAALWAAAQPPGRYTMQDVLGFTPSA
jgi:4-hydroxy-tetrahydrodipicolinate reductase